MSLKEKIKQKTDQLKIDIPAVYLVLKDRETPVLAKILAGLAVAYALSPIDLIPDFIPVIGYLDDLIILPLLVAWIIKLIPKEKFEECRAQAKLMWQDGKPVKWYYALPIVVFWLLIVFIIVKAIWFSKA